MTDQNPTAYMVVRIEGEVPESVGLAAYRAFSAIVTAWQDLSGKVGQESFVELLGFCGEEEGPGRRRKSVLDRLYAKREESAE